MTMHRRHFISLSGASLAALLLQQDLYAGAAAPLLQMPKSISILLDDGTHPMQAAGNGNWFFRDNIVQLKYKQDSLHVTIAAPTSPISGIVLEWRYTVSTSTTLLGDHWERSYGVLHFQPASFSRKMPWYFIQHDARQTLCFGVMTGCPVIAHWQVGDGKMSLTLDTRNGGSGTLLSKRTLEAAAIVCTKSKPGENSFATAHRFCGILCTKPRLPKQPVYGINDWYVTYGNNSAAIILDHTARMAELVTDHSNRPFSVVDSGWAAYSPLLPNDCCWQDDYSRPNDHFRDMHVLAGNIKKLGFRAGLWTRPLCAAHDIPQTLRLPSIPGRTNAKQPVLDPSITENIELIQHNIRLYREWGYELVKHDFTTYDILGKWGNHMQEDISSTGWHFYDRSKTTAEIILQLYQALRAAAGDMYLLGCNTLSHLSAGLFELNRIGDDTSGREWKRTRQMGVNTLGFRLVQHNRFYAADGDCVGLTTTVPWQLNKQWMQLLAESGTPLFISAQAAATGNEQKQFIRQSFATAARTLPPAEPLDWLSQQWPEHWRLNGHEVRFNWND